MSKAHLQILFKKRIFSFIIGFLSIGWTVSAARCNAKMPTHGLPVHTSETPGVTAAARQCIHERWRDPSEHVVAVLEAAELEAEASTATSSASIEL